MSVRVQLRELAFARSGDKGDVCNIGLMARSPAIFEHLREVITPELVARHYGAMVTGAVEVYEAANIASFVIVLRGGLGGGATTTLRYDQTGKSMGTALLRCVVDVPADLLPEPPLPIVPWMHIDGGRTWLQGLRCGACGEVFTDARDVCAACFVRGRMEPLTLGSTGRLHAFTVVQRSFPGVAVPYVSAVVDLDGGGTLKGNLVDAGHDPAALHAGMAVDVIFVAAPERGPQGQVYLVWAFVPRRSP